MKIKLNKQIIISLLLFVLFSFYFLTGVCITYKIEISDVWGCLFDNDLPRIVSDFYSNSLEHYRTKVHPIYILLIQPTIKLINIFMKNGVVSIIFLQSLIGVINVCLLNYILTKISKKTSKQINVLKYTLLFLYSVSFTQIIYSSIPESFVFGCCTLLIYWAYFVSHYKKDMTKWHQYLIFSLVCALPLTITTTNFLCVLVSAPFFIYHNCEKNLKSISKKTLFLMLTLLLPIVLVYFLSLIQQIIWISSENWFEYIFLLIGDLLNGTTKAEDWGYIATKNDYLNVFNSFFGYSFLSPNISGTYYINFGHYSLFIIITLCAFLFIFSLFIIKLIICAKKNSFELIFSYSLVSQILFHIVFGANEAFLYTQNVLYLVIILIFLSVFNHDKIINWASFIIFIFGLICFISNIITIIEIKQIFSNYYPVNDFKISLAFIKSIVLIFSCSIISSIFYLFYKNKNKFNNFIIDSLIIISIVSLVCSSYIPIKGKNNDEVYYIFGMGLRDKFIISGTKKNATLSNLSGDIIYDRLYIENIDYTNYSVEAKKENISIKIYENEEGIYLNNNNYTMPLSDDIHITIPSFNQYSNRDLMRALFNELMVNVLPQGPTPNLFYYGNVWYRDAAIMAMAIEKTGNIDQIMNWLNTGITKMYDNSRNPSLNEVDNLGNVLYLQSLASEKNYDLINSILEEANKIKVDKKNYINGITDGGYHPVYQTGWLKFGLKSLGLDDSMYEIPDIYDDYASLLWFDNSNITNTNINELEYEYIKRNDEIFPYLKIARYHFYKQKIDFKNYTYPYSYEDNLKLPGRHAAELLLYLYDYDTF